MLIAAGALLCALGAMEAKAATVLVYEDDLNYSFALSVSKGVATITFSSVTLADVNTGKGPQPDVPVGSALGTLTFTYTGPTAASAPYFTGVSSAATTKTIGPDAGTANAILTYNVNLPGPKTSLTSDGFLNLKGTVTGISAAHHTIVSTGGTTFDFSPFASGKGTANLTFVSGSNIAAILAAGTGTATGTGGFQEQVVPEPASIALLGIGMTGFLAFRRFFKKTNVAA